MVHNVWKGPEVRWGTQECRWRQYALRPSRHAAPYTHLIHVHAQVPGDP